MNIRYRQGKKEDSYRIAELDNCASDGAIDYLFHGLVPGMTPIEIVASGLENDTDPHTFRNAIVAESVGKIIGMSLSFPAYYHAITDELRAFLPADRLEHFREFFSTRVEGSYFLDALCVDEQYRGRGIGSRLIELMREKAQQEGYAVLSLIVFADNISAQRLYRRSGFEIVKNIELKPHTLLPHEGGCLLMKADITVSQRHGSSRHMVAG